MEFEPRKNVLIVEDDKDIATAIAKALRRLGYAIAAIVESGEEAVDKVSQALPDLVIMDVNLAGELNGMEVGKRIESLFHIPAVYITGYLGKAIALQERGKIPLVKPFSIEDLRAAIKVAFLGLST